MRINVRMLWLAGAALALAAFSQGCGSFLPEPDGGAGGGSGGCTADAQCSSFVCNTSNNTCMTACSSQSSCTSTQQCARMDGTLVADGGTPGFCQCTAGNCGTQICQQYTTHLCGTGCAGTSNPCPTGFSCEMSTGVCVPPNQDGGVCNDLDQCDPGKVCDFASGACRAAGSCSTSNPQPDTCGYAGYCAAGTCAQVDKACGNFSAPAFNPRTSTGPVIWKVESVVAPHPDWCFKGLYVHSFFLTAYQSTDWPVAAASPAFHLVNPAHQDINVTQSLTWAADSYVVNASNHKEVRVLHEGCAYTSTPLVEGYYFANGSEACTPASTPTAGTRACAANTDCNDPGSTAHTCNVGTGTCQ